MKKRVLAGKPLRGRIVTGPDTLLDTQGGFRRLKKEKIIAKIQ